MSVNGDFWVGASRGQSQLPAKPLLKSVSSNVVYQKAGYSSIRTGSRLRASANYGTSDWIRRRRLVSVASSLDAKMLDGEFMVVSCLRKSRGVDKIRKSSGREVVSAPIQQLPSLLSRAINQKNILPAPQQAIVIPKVLQRAIGKLHFQLAPARGRRR